LFALAGNCLERAAEALHDLIENGGYVDHLDTNPIWGEYSMIDNDDDKYVLKAVVENFES